MSEKYLLGIDNGGTVIKAALFDERGNQLACEETKTPLLTPREGFTERSLQSVREANFEIISRIARKYGDNIAAVGVCGHGKGLYVLGKNGENIRDGIGSTDSRALSYELMWAENGTSARARELTAQKTFACHPAALLRWLKDNERSVYDKIGHILAVKDYVRYCLTGEIYTDYTDISGSGLLNMQTREYDRGLTELYGIPEIFSALPEIRSSGELCGCITAECADATGLKQGTPVVGGMFDIDACAVAMGCTAPGDMCIIAGTWSVNEYVSESPVTDGSVSMNSVFCDPAYYLAEESSAASAGNLEWFRSYLNNSGYAALDAEVQALDPRDCPVYYLPFLYASNEAPELKAALVGLSGSHTRAHMLRAIYEGVAFSHLTHIDALLKSRPAPPRARLAGGAANSEVWARIFADTFGFELELTKNVQLGCKGAAMAAAVGAGMFEDYKAAAEAFVQPGEAVCPDPEKTEVYREKYKTYKAIASALGKIKL